MNIRLTGDAAGVDAVFSRIERALSDASVGPLREGLTQAGNEYLAFCRERFEAEGFGTWDDLAGATQAQRKYLGYAPAHPILKRKDILRRGLSPDRPGNVFLRDKDGIFVGYGGSFAHPGYETPKGRRTGGGVPLVQIAKAQHYGTAKIPARPILVYPNPRTVKYIRRAIAEAVIKTIQEIDAVSPRRRAA